MSREVSGAIVAVAALEDWSLGDAMDKVTATHNHGDTFGKCHHIGSQDVSLHLPNQTLGLKEYLIELTPENLIACCKCRTIADVSVIGSRLKLICPRCYETLGSWATTSEAVADMAAFVAGCRAGE
jgi:hypothetical protein